MQKSLTQIVREPEVFRTPKNLFLQCLIFWIVFFFMELAQSVFLIPAMWKSLMQWSREQLQQTGTLDSDAMMTKIQQLMLEPELVNAMLYATIAGTLVIFFFCRVIEGRKLSTLGFQKSNAVKHYFIGLGTGFLLFSAVVGLTFFFGGLKFEGLQKFSPAILITLFGYGFQGMNEEVAYRGYCMTTILRNHSVYWAVGLNALFFGLAHAGNQGFSLFALLNLCLYAVMISLYVLKTNSLWGACAIHSIWNFAQGNFYGLPVSGINSGESVFRMSLTSSEFINGGNFGLEAGFPCTIILSIAIIILIFLLSKSKPLPEQEQA